MGAEKVKKPETETAKKPEKAKAAAEAEAKPAKKANNSILLGPQERWQPLLLSLTQQNDTGTSNEFTHYVIEIDGTEVERAPPRKKQKTEVRVNARPTTHGCTYPGKTV